MTPKKLYLIVVFAILLFIRLGGSEEKVEQESLVIVLDDSNYAQQLGKNESILIDFYVPWCPHCEKLAPSFEEAAKLAKEEKLPVVLGKVNCLVARETCQVENVGVYPTIRLFRPQKEPVTYTASKKALPIFYFLRKMS